MGFPTCIRKTFENNGQRGGVGSPTCIRTRFGKKNAKARRASRKRNHIRCKLDGSRCRIVVVPTRPQPAALAAPRRESTSQTLPQPPHTATIKPVRLPERASPWHRLNGASTRNSRSSKSVWSTHKTQATSPVEKAVGVTRSTLHQLSGSHQQEQATSESSFHDGSQARHQTHIQRSPQSAHRSDKSPGQVARVRRFDLSRRRMTRQLFSHSRRHLPAISHHLPSHRVYTAEEPIVQVIVNRSRTNGVPDTAHGDAVFGRVP